MTEVAPENRGDDPNGLMDKSRETPLRVLIISCPTCGTDLTDEAFSYWCPACHRSVSFAEAAIYDETDYEDE